MWLGSSVFDGARWFEGVAPDLDMHAQRVNSSALALGLKPTMTAEEIVGLTWDGLKKFDGKTAVYIRPMYWAEHGGYMGVPADAESTRFCLCLYEAPMMAPSGFSITMSPFRRPSMETMPTNAKSGCLYPNNARAIMEAQFPRLRQLAGARHAGQRRRDRLVEHLHGPRRAGPHPGGQRHVPCRGSRAPAPLRCCPSPASGSARKRLTAKDFMDADEIFSTGNHSKVVPVIRIEDRNLQPGPVAKKARDLYWEWAHSTPGRLRRRGRTIYRFAGEGPGCPVLPRTRDSF